MGSEAGLRSTLKKKMKGIAHYVRVENSCSIGTPDVNIAWAVGNSCWVELKYLGKFPVRERTNVKLECFTEDQIKWLLSRWAVKKGGSWLFVQVGDMYYLFTALAAAKIYYGANTNEFKDLATWTGKKGWYGTEFLHVMEISPISAF